MMAARTLYELGRLKNGGLSFRDCEIPELWNHSRNGTYAILATRLLRANPHLSKTSLWREIQQAVRREVGDEPAWPNAYGVRESEAVGWGSKPARAGGRRHCQSPPW